MTSTQRYSFTLLAVFILCISVQALNKVNVWGFFAHRKINELAVYALPDSMHIYLRSHIEYLSEHAVDPDRRRHSTKGEAEKHYIDLDYYPYDIKQLADSFPKSWEMALSCYPEDTLRTYGIAPWNLQQYHYRLVKQFQGRDLSKLLKTMADYGHYVGDIHVPLHTTMNYNGQLTGQKGIHGLWETRLPELFFDEYDLLVEEVKYIDDVQELIWSVVLESHRLMPEVLHKEMMLSKANSSSKYTFEERGERTTTSYAKSFSQLYHDNLNGMVEQRMRCAVSCLASLWYTAWVDAGQPSLKEFE
ncbi:zinc dependent phospholipase C family protein [Luteibaculum oceani]|uniref:S1/P1 Nuclease n=1 Tax=Luteibaculum oceani TaxID=1294296 RepID=A0A5C6VBW2_9FLAO|nr:zinc dependent phospholipase C family protein [Luteibaculum oceani]TXC81956.1 S1/P1 Nuclease [Luteibaculum oceani]